LTTTNARRSIIQEASGACPDLGTFIPHVIVAMTRAGLAPVGVLFGFAVFLIPAAIGRRTDSRHAAFDTLPDIGTRTTPASYLGSCFDPNSRNDHDATNCG